VLLKVDEKKGLYTKTKKTKKIDEKKERKGVGRRCLYGAGDLC
jgi:hypothetical protein